MVSGERATKREIAVYLLPTLILMSIAAAVPLLQTLILSFSNSQLSSENLNFIGFANFIYLLRDSTWWKAVGNTIEFSFVSVSIELVLGLAFASLLNGVRWARGPLRLCLLLPWAIPTVVSSRFWSWAFNDIYGVINHILMRLQIIEAPIAWLAHDKLAFFSIVFVDVWKSTPFMALLFLAGMQSIPPHLYDTAKLEKTSAWHRFLYITLPLLKPTIWIALIFRTLDALRVFDLPYIMTSQTPENSMMSTFVRKQMIDFQDLGFGSASAVGMFCVVACVCLTLLFFGRKEFRFER